MEFHKPKFRKKSYGGSRDNRGSGYKGPREDRSSGYRGPREDRSSGYKGPRDDRSSGHSGSRDDRRSSSRGPRNDRSSGYRGPREDRSSGYRGPRNDRSSGYRGPRSDRVSGYGRDSRSGGSRFNRSDRGSRFNRGSENRGRLETTTVTCADCGETTQIPFKPKTDRPVYCRDCFQDHKPAERGGGFRSNRDQSYGRRDSGSRYNRGQSRFQRDRTPIHDRDNFRSNRDAPNRESFRKNSMDDKPNSFYSTLRKKLFSVMGEQKCANCGFEDERALGFELTDDAGSFDYVQRAGAASSWEKYVSDPDLAKQELQIICLNCNMIKQKQLAK